ncbi:MAG: flagellar motor protein MotD [Rhodanobacter sp.]
MSRRHKHEEHLNHEAWAIPYADLITLLLAFFVVMYAVSVVNAGKYRVLSEAMIEAFNGSSHVIAPLPPTKVKPHNVDPSIASPEGQAGAVAVVSVPIPPHPVALQGGNGRNVGASDASGADTLKRIGSEVSKALQPLIDSKQVVVRNKQLWLEIEIRTDLLFPSGVAQLSTKAETVLHNLAGVLAGFSNPLRIEGFTDNVPISTAQFPSNWELSAARAASVARLFEVAGIAQDRLGIVGWGETHPVADNGTAEGRAANRRILVVVMGEGSSPQRTQSDVGHIDHQPGVANVAGAASAAAAPASGLPAAKVLQSTSPVPSDTTRRSDTPALQTLPTATVTPASAASAPAAPSAEPHAKDAS